jgi:hypothetical protein
MRDSVRRGGDVFVGLVGQAVPGAGPVAAVGSSAARQRGLAARVSAGAGPPALGR